jgi:hypothetical protein
MKHQIYLKKEVSELYVSLAKKARTKPATFLKRTLESQGVIALVKEKATKPAKTG